ncbi:MAG: magnesium transporter CorA family protein [Spirochaetia bacterium]|nr:magnesium transporter CorA family protein [Spirochaetia bacterium]
MFRGFVFLTNKITEINEPKEIMQSIKDPRICTWIDLEDPSEAEIDFLIDEFNFHPLSIEDAILPQDHAKIESFDEYIFLTLYAMNYIDESINPQELNIFLGKNYVITFHENRLSCISKMTARILALARKEDYNTRSFNLGKGADTLLHAVIDLLIDEYFPITDRIEDRIAQLEDRILEEKTENIMEDTLRQKRNILILRKFIYLEKQVMAKLLKGEIKYIKESNKTYFQDIYDHIVNMQETLEILREVVPSLIESYHSMTSKKLNQLIHRLTILATVAIPMTVVTSFYGMNLQLPEFKWGVWGYVFMWCMLLGSSGLTFIWLKIKKWI